jgi:hypothetical protein
MVVLSNKVGAMAQGGSAYVEIPQVYPRAPEDPNDLINVAYTAGAVCHYLLFMGCSVRRVIPHAWKGNVPKEVSHRRIIEGLTPENRDRVTGMLATYNKTVRHNLLDALGIALYGIRKREGR